MSLLNGITGVLALFASFFCFFRPGESVLSLGWLAAWVLLFWGISSVISCLIDRKHGEASKQEKRGGAVGLTFGLVLCGVSLLSIFSTEVQLLMTRIVLIILGIAVLLSGIVNIAARSSCRESRGKRLFLLIFGILEVLAGLAALLDFIFAADLAGILIGIMLAVFGIAMLGTAFGSGSLSWFDRIAERG